MQSRILFENQYYVACLTRAGLSVQRKPRMKGLILPAQHPQYGSYLAAFDTAMDDVERAALCRGLLNA